MEQEEDDDPRGGGETFMVANPLATENNNTQKDPDKEMDWASEHKSWTPLRGKEDIINQTRQEGVTHYTASYINTLLGINGSGNYKNNSSGNENQWEDFEDFEDDMLGIEDDNLDPLCPVIPVTSKERRNLCKPWRKAIIIKLLGRTVGYRYLYARLPKIWKLTSNFEMIDLQNNFFVVRFVEKSDYDRVLFDGPWMVLGHYLTIQ